MLNQYNALYDPLMGRSVCVSGQLYLLELAMHLYKDIPNLSIVALNTDGIMMEFDDSHYEDVLTITREWEARTGFELEEDEVTRIYQKDVNNYIEVQSDGKAKAKGGYLVRGIGEAGAFKVNNNMVIVAKALQEALVHGTDIEETIRQCNDPTQFQYIARSGAQYGQTFHLVDGERVSVQKVNRVYATKDERYGTLYKVKGDAVAKIGNLPEHCVIDNEGRISIDQIDKDYYIQLCKKQLDDFRGIKPEKKGRKKKVATEKTETIDTKNMNLLEKLMCVREEVLQSGISKQGKNPSLKSFYFTLDDIVTTSLPIFKKYRLCPVTTFTAEEGVMRVTDMDSMNDRGSNCVVSFTMPWKDWAGNAAVTPVQAAGSTVTYMRRYLYQLALDLVEADEMESGALPTSVPQRVNSQNPTQLPAVKPPVAPVKPNAPVNNAEAKATLTADGPATELQIKGLKNALKKLIAKDQPRGQSLANKISLETNAFQQVCKSRCEELIQQVMQEVGE